MTLCLDISNYTSPLSVEKVWAWQAAGVGLVIIQCFPPSYPQWAEQLAQIRACTEAGMPWDAYIYDYLGDPTWRDSALGGLRQLRDQDYGPRQVWLDEEDTETEQGWPVSWRQDAVRASEAAVIGAGFWCGIYTAAWWWVPKMGNTREFAVLELWDADYDALADTEASWTPYGGWTQRRIKQHIGSTSFLGVTGVDLNILSIEEAAELQPPPLENPCAGLINALAYVCDDLGDALALETTRRTVRKTEVRRVVQEMRRVRTEQVGIR